MMRRKSKVNIKCFVNILYTFEVIYIYIYIYCEKTKKVSLKNIGKRVAFDVRINL
jgi:ribosomal protein L23